MYSLQISFPEFVFGLLTGGKYTDDPIVLSLTSRIDEIVAAVSKYSEVGRQKIQDLANKVAMETYKNEAARLATQDGGLHFNVTHANVEQLEDFSISNLAVAIKQNAPRLWATLDVVLSAHSTGTSRTREDDDTNKWNVYWDALEGSDMRRGQSTRWHLDRWQAVTTIVSNTIDAGW